MAKKRRPSAKKSFLKRAGKVALPAGALASALIQLIRLILDLK